MTIRPGDAAPEFCLADLRGERPCVEHLRGRPVILVFLRYLGWLACEEHLSQLRQRQAELQPARVVIITFASAAKAAGALQPWLPCFEVWVDPQREAYRAWGLGSRRLGLFNLGTVRLYARLLLRGKRWRPLQWDLTQLGGDAVLDADGVVRLWHAGRTPDDRPPIGALIRAVNPDARSAT